MAETEHRTPEEISEQSPQPTGQRAIPAVATAAENVSGAIEALTAVRGKWQETSNQIQIQINSMREARDSLGDKITDIDDALHILGYIEPKPPKPNGPDG